MIHWGAKPFDLIASERHVLDRAFAVGLRVTQLAVEARYIAKDAADGARAHLLRLARWADRR